LLHFAYTLKPSPTSTLQQEAPEATRIRFGETVEGVDPSNHRERRLRKRGRLTSSSGMFFVAALGVARLDLKCRIGGVHDFRECVAIERETAPGVAVPRWMMVF